MSKIMQLDWSKMTKQSSVNSLFTEDFTEKFFVSIRQVGKQAHDLESFFLRILDTSHPFKLLF